VDIEASDVVCMLECEFRWEGGFFFHFIFILLRVFPSLSLRYLGKTYAWGVWRAFCGTEVRVWRIVALVLLVEWGLDCLCCLFLLSWESSMFCWMEVAVGRMLVSHRSSPCLQAVSEARLEA